MPITLDLRQAIIHKVHGESEEDLRHMIEGSINGPEAALPGLGAVFEMIWPNIDQNHQNEMVHILHEHLKQVTPQPLK
ncbi:small acid-soluble spore protein SspI [Paenibacillus sp. P96]|uniref:Small, acid-soluble spore protein I n=1 Tax=Paenibacillus zeirhizosphaerae TaxID=2987519 RepID=A0ABT9FUH3_9BACL|nr:small acid-soluble spore protein SspI [Paenibacillus sp. P96]MDP4098389.1 small acid-soluble spore protein SspI [Paenibacillus sp. P96]